jgi:hypothetical protein
LFEKLCDLDADNCIIVAEKIKNDDELAVMPQLWELVNWLEDRAVELKEEEYEDE